MTEYDIGPDYVQINYHSNFGIHTASHSVLQWIDAASAGGQGQFLTHNAGQIDAVAMVEAFVDTLLGLHGAETTYDSWVVFHKPTPTGPSFPVAGKALTAKVGTIVATYWYKAVQHTLNFRDVEFNAAKVVALDAATYETWDKEFTPQSYHTAIINEIADPDNGWCSRAGNRIDQFVSATHDLNDRLRRAYRMS